jgi:hypothetical protein
MATIPIIEYSVDERSYFLSFIKEHISEYKLSELTGNYMGDVPSIQNAHPLAVEYGNMLSASAEGAENYTSILPAIGVELTENGEGGQQYLGAGKRSYEITQDYIDEKTAIELKDRFKNGLILSSTNLTNLQAMKTAKGSDELWSTKKSYLQDVNLAISIWSDHPDITNILFNVLGDILKRAKHDISSNGVKNMKIQGIGSIYNFEFHKTLYGAEYTINLINSYDQITVDDSIGTISQVDESVVSSETQSKPIFVGKGE